MRAVIGWYNAQLAAERRSADPDEGRIDVLRTERQEAVEDQQRLSSASPEETSRIGALYAARFKELNAE